MVRVKRTRSSLEANCITNQTVAVREGNITKVNTNFNSITDVNMELNNRKYTSRKFASFEHVCTAHTGHISLVLSCRKRLRETTEQKGEKEKR